MTAKKNGLLPIRFKIIGLIVVLLSFVSAIVVSAMHIEMTPANKELFRIFALNAFILGLLLVAWSRDKIEDEMTISLRFKAIAFAFIWTVLLVVITPFVELIFNDSIADINGRQLIVDMLLAYLIIYYLQKSGR